MTSFDYDLIVIGGGSGGLAAAKEAGKYGVKVALLDYVDPSTQGTRWGVGGTCVNVGCIPKKLMHRAAAIHGDIDDAEGYGWTGIDKSNIKLDWNKLVYNVTQHIHATNFGYKNQLRAFQVELIPAKAYFIDAHTIGYTRGGKDKKITGNYIVIAVGGRPTVPKEIPGALEHCITSDDLFSLDHAPGKTLTIGASYVSLECAGFLTELGFDVTVMVRSSILRNFDQECAQRVGAYMADHGTKFLHHTVPLSFTKGGTDGKKIIVKAQNLDTKKEVEDIFDTVLIATGRLPNTSALQLEKAGVTIDAKTQKIITNDEDRTVIPNIFCIGDAQLGAPELTPTAIQAGKFLSRRLFDNQTQKRNYDIVPTAIFTPLEYGSVGLSEEKALQQYNNIPPSSNSSLIIKSRVVVYYGSFTPYEWSLSNVSLRPKDTGFIKLVCVVPLGEEIEFKEIPLPPDEKMKRRKVGEEEEEEEGMEKEETILVPLKKEDQRGNEKVVGIHYVGPNAAEVINGWAVALTLGVTKKHFEEVAGIHPCSSDEVNLVNVLKGTRVSLNRIACCG